MCRIVVPFIRLNPKAIVPAAATSGSAGIDLYCVPEGDSITIAPGQTVFLHTGIAAAIPEGYVGLVFARSGLASKRGLAPANKVGVIDSDYRGEWMIAMHNHGQVEQTITPGDRIAQVVILPAPFVEFAETTELDDTDRGEGGFGSTGVGTNT